jgi:hypothetical protein
MNTRLWGWPILLGLVTAVGLVSALVADGFWDTVSWLALGLPVAMASWYGLRRKPSSSRS